MDQYDRDRDHAMTYTYKLDKAYLRVGTGRYLLHPVPAQQRWAYTIIANGNDNAKAFARNLPKDKFVVLEYQGNYHFFLKVDILLENQYEYTM